MYETHTDACARAHEYIYYIYINNRVQRGSSTPNEKYTEATYVKSNSQSVCALVCIGRVCACACVFVCCVVHELYAEIFVATLISKKNHTHL